MPRQTANARRSIDGFTLIEIVVALSLVSAILLGMLSALRTLGASAGRVDHLVERTETMRALSGFLRRTLQVVAPPPKLAGQAKNAWPPMVGTGQSIEWTGLFPARFGAGGMHRFSLGTVDSGSDTKLVLRFAPADSGIGAPRWDAIAPALIVDEVTRIEVRYQDEEGEWREQWGEEDGVPQRVTIRILAEDQAWPPIVVVPSSIGGDPGERMVHGPV